MIQNAAARSLLARAGDAMAVVDANLRTTSIPSGKVRPQAGVSTPAHLRCTAQHR
jgi:hypothetical protein